MCNNNMTKGEQDQLRSNLIKGVGTLAVTECIDNLRVLSQPAVNAQTWSVPFKIESILSCIAVIIQPLSLAMIVMEAECSLLPHLENTAVSALGPRPSALGPGPTGHVTDKKIWEHSFCQKCCKKFSANSILPVLWLLGSKFITDRRTNYLTQFTGVCGFFLSGG